MLAVPAFAQLPPPGRNAIAARLVAESGATTAGGNVTLALVMTPEKGWHGYWKNPGDAGVETRIDWMLPFGVSAGPLQYPVPGRLLIAGLMNYVYEGRYAQLIALDIPAGLAPGTKLPLKAKVDYLACTDEVCVPETANVALDLIIGSGAEPRARQAEFDRYRAALPKPLASEARFQSVNGRFRLAVPIPASSPVSEAYFYPLTDRALAYAAAQKMSRRGNLLILETEAGGGKPALVEGVLAVGKDQGLALTARSGIVPAGGDDAPRPPQDGGAGIFLALAGAILGGLLLNIMPCVFPILSLKALSLAKAGGDEAQARREAIAYTAGIVSVCLALGAGLLALRAGGAAVGWAFQLQDPRVILFLLLLVVAIALNLAGLFELPTIAAGESLAGGGGSAGAFWTGALAAFVATPCTGPFMAGALGAALVLPTAASLAIFAGLGLGLALPFLLLGFSPALRRRLPRPGPWMERLRRILSVPMFATALGLAWILGRQAGVDGMTIGLSAALAVALSLWWFGRRQTRPRAWLPLAPAMLAALAAILLVPVGSAPAAAAAGRARLGAEPFSEARLAALRSEGRPVFVYFTADWCLTCKVNENGALASRTVADAFAAGKVAVLEGDWTRGDAAIGHFLESHGRSGVPLYLYYAPGEPAETLPQLLTANRLSGLAR